MLTGKVSGPRRVSVRKDDTVEVISGKDRGKRGEVVRVDRVRGRVVVSGVNIARRHQKASARVMQSGIVEQENPIDVSNVMVVCRHCKRPTRVGHMEQDGRRVRRCVRCGQSLDR
jgi:large subunit ribosomal protein L24